MLNSSLEHALFTPQEAPPEAQKAEENSERIRFLTAFWTMALERARDHGLSPGSPEAWDMVEEAGNIGSDISFLYQLSSGLDAARSHDPETVTAANRMRMRFYGDPLRVLTQDVIYPVAGDLESAAAQYFNSGWRSPELDRYVLRLLLERELAMFVRDINRGDTIFGEESPFVRAEKILRTTAIGQTLKAVLWILVALGAILGLVIVFPGMPAAIPIIAGGAVLVLGALWLGFLICAFAVHGRRYKKQAQRTIDLVSMAIDVLLKHDDNGPLAVSDFRRDLERLRDAGFVLPQTLFGMMDEYEARGVRRL